MGFYIGIFGTNYIPCKWLDPNNQPSVHAASPQPGSWPLQRGRHISEIASHCLPKADAVPVALPHKTMMRVRVQGSTFLPGLQAYLYCIQPALFSITQMHVGQGLFRGSL